MTGDPVITLLTDFGDRDGYVGAVRGVLLARCPRARLVDITHAIDPGAIEAGAFVLAQAAPWFPAGTVHLAVVDPGVGTRRRGLACRIDGSFFVAPDNGLLDRVLARAREVEARSIENPALWLRPVSAVFHGRDVFGPVAAHLAAGGALEAVGPEVDPATLVRLPWPEPRVDAHEAEGVVVHVDRFGNLVTNLPPPPAGREVAVEIEGRAVPWARTYGDVAPGEPLALVGSSGAVEIACREASAAARLGLGRGARVRWRAGGGGQA